MNNLGNVCKVLGYAVAGVSVIYTGSAILANSPVSAVALRVIGSSPFKGAGFGLVTFGCIGAWIGYSEGDSMRGKNYANRYHKALIGGIIGGVSGALNGAILLTAYNHLSIHVV